MIIALICFALKEEAGRFRKIVAGKSGISILLTGIGRQNAEKTVREFLATNSPELVLTCGFAGALNPAFAVGEVVFSTDDAKLHNQLLTAGTRPASFYCASKVVTTVTEKQELRRTTAADAVEMESEAIHAVCRERGIPCATVRVISDTASEDLPLDFNRLSNADLRLNYGRLALAIAKSPGKIPALLRLRRNSRFAAERLADVLGKIISLP